MPNYDSYHGCVMFIVLHKCDQHLHVTNLRPMDYIAPGGKHYVEDNIAVCSVILLLNIQYWSYHTLPTINRIK